VSTTILGITDTHWSEIRPGSRTDVDWKETQNRKMQMVFKLAREIKSSTGETGAAAIVHSGDLFNQPSGPLIPRTTDTWVSEILSKTPVPICSIPGNHDMKGHRKEACSNHPYGVLSYNKVVLDVCWPRYQVVGTDPIVIITGWPYTPRGPAEFFEFLRVQGSLRKLRDELEQSSGKKVYVVGLAHGFFGPTAGTAYGEGITPYTAILGTGIDALQYGHPHTFDGEVVLEEDGRKRVVLGPGALLRGTLAEHDVNRKPAISVIEFTAAGFECKFTSVPHKPAAEVFDLVKHKKQAREQVHHTRFVEALRRVDPEGLTIEALLEQMRQEASIDDDVITLFRHYVQIAGATEEG